VAGENILVIDDNPTLLKIVSRTLGRAGYRVRTAEGGARGVSAAKSERPDVILLDYLMPGLDGEAVCRALGQDPTLRDVPVIVMSAKGDKINTRFVEQLGAVDYIAKPFTPELIVNVTEGAVVRYVREGTPAPRLSLANPAASQVAARPAEPTGHGDHLQRIRARLHESIAPALGEALSAMPEAARAEASARAAAVEHALSAALSEAVLLDVSGLAAQAFPASTLTDDVVLRADLGAIAIADLLQIFQIQRQIGVLSVSHGDAHVLAYFRDGHIDWVGGKNLPEEFLLGRFIVETQAMSNQDLDLFLRSRSGTRKLLGAQLVKLGYITEADLATALARQSAEILYETMRWRTGRCEFRARAQRPEHVTDAHLDLSVEQILMEGFRRLDAWSLIESVIHSPDIVFARNEDAIESFGVERLEPAELTVLELIDGQNRVRELVEKSRLGTFMVSQTLYQLLASGLVRKRVEPAPPSA